MSISHRSNRLKLIGNPSVEKLQNGRFRLTFNLKPLNPRSDWYNANKDRIFADYGTLQSAEMSIDGIAPRTGEAYGDMALVKAESAQSGDEYIVQFIYETLGATFIQTKDDTISYTENGLRRVTRESIAAAGTDFQKTVGTSTITSQIDDETAVTCYLASYEVDETDSYRKVTEIYLEAGEVQRLERTIGDGVSQVTVESIFTKPTIPDGAYIISESNDNVNGLDSYTTSYVASKDGTGLTQADGGEKEIFSYQKLVPFVFPGVVDLMETGGNAFPAVRSPVQADILADVITYYQTSSSIESTDFTKESALGLWNPSEWCQKIAHIDSFYNEDTGQVEPAYFNSQGLRGCRTRTSFGLSGSLTSLNSNAFDYTEVGVRKALSSLTLEETTESRNGRSIYRDSFEYTYDITSRISINSLGVYIFRGSIRAYAKFDIECSWNGSQWELIVDHIIVDPQPSDGANSGSTFTWTYSSAQRQYVDVYTNATSTINNNTVVFTSTNGALSPDQANWPSYLTVSEISNEEKIGGTSISSATLGYSGGETVLVDGFGGWIEGRRAPFNANGQISISGGPDNPLGRKYVLDVNLKKSFTDIDGTDVYQKQVVVATCTPA
jgi:hypothetical protein